MCMSRISLYGIYDGQSKGGINSPICIVSLLESKRPQWQRYTVRELLCCMVAQFFQSVSKTVGKRG